MQLSFSFTNHLSTCLILFLVLPSTGLPSAAMILLNFSALADDLSQTWLFNSMTLIFPMIFSSAFTQP